jgi:hypothetical protein
LALFFFFGEAAAAAAAGATALDTGFAEAAEDEAAAARFGDRVLEAAGAAAGAG